VTPQFMTRNGATFFGFLTSSRRGGWVHRARGPLVDSRIRLPSPMSLLTRSRPVSEAANCTRLVFLSHYVGK